MTKLKIFKKNKNKLIGALSVSLLLVLLNIRVASAVFGADDMILAINNSIEGFLAAILAFFSLFLFGAGHLLNLSVDIGVLKMGEVVSQVEAVSIGWRMIRDVINIFFIFGLLYISITTILKGWGDSSKKMLGNIILAAVLINFSFFFTSVMIDASNLISLKFVEAMDTCNIEDGGAVRSNLSNCFMNALKLSSTHQGLSVEDGGEIIDVAKEILAQIIFILIAAFVFFAAAISIFARFIILVILLVTSPLMFLGMILPKTSKISQDWFKKLSEQLVFMPVFFMLLYVTYLMVLSRGDSTLFAVLNVNPESGYSAFAQNGTMEIVLSYFIIIGFLLASLITSKKIGAASADFATKTAGNVVFGGAAKAGRLTIGRLGKAAADSDRFKKWSESNNVVARATGNALVKSGNWTSERSLDLRQAPGAAAVLKATNIEADKAQKGGFKKEVEERTKKVEKDNKLFERKEYKDNELLSITADNFEKEIDKIKFREAKRALEDSNKNIITKEENIARAERAVEQAENGPGKQSQEFTKASSVLSKARSEYDTALKQKDDSKKALKTIQETALKLEGAKKRYDKSETPVFGTAANVFNYLTARNKSNQEFLKKLEKELKKGKDEQNLDKLIKGIKESSKSDGGDKKDGGGDKDK